MNRLQHIIFDLDGTLIDSKNEILKTYKQVFNDVRPSHKPDTDSLNYGLTLNDVLKSVYHEETDKIVIAKQLFASLYDVSDYKETTLYEGVAENLEALVSEGFVLYIATNKRLRPTQHILEAMGLRHLFARIMANEMEPGVTLSKREMVAALKSAGGFEDGYMAGDSASDIIAGKEEQLRTIAVTYGYERAEILAALTPTIITDSFQNLYTFVVENSKH